MQRYVILLMAGRSQRFGHGDKCLALADGKPIVFYAFETFRRAKIFDHYFFVHRDDSQKRVLEKFFQSYYPTQLLSQITWIPGGNWRTLSVYNALQVIHKQFSMEAFIFIHDGARPLITTGNIDELNASLSVKHGAVLAHRATDTTMVTDVSWDSNKNNTTTKEQRQYLERKTLWALETPQAFYLPAIFEDYKTAIHSQCYPTDDSSLFSGTVKILENGHLNLKITTPQDLALVRSSLPIPMQM